MQANQLIDSFPATPQFQRSDSVEERASVIINNDDDDDRPNAEEITSKFAYDFNDFINNGMVNVEEKSDLYKSIEKIFVSGLGNFANDTKIVAIHMNNVCSDFAMRARWLSFKIFGKAVSEKSGAGDGGNAKFCWYGGSRSEICQIISHGFNRCSEFSNGDQSHGVGVYLSPASLGVDCVGSSAEDANELRHMLLCRVILGKLEQIPAGSTQTLPSSPEFNSGVDNLEKPTKYIVWTPFMNSHIFPACVISFKVPNVNGKNKDQVKKSAPTSPWLSFPVLLKVLSKVLEPSKMDLLCKSHDDFRKNKISRVQLIQSARQICGDRLLAQIIGRFKSKLAMNKSWHC